MDIKIKKLNHMIDTFKKVFQLLILLLFTVTTILVIDNGSLDQSYRQPLKCKKEDIKKNVVFLKTHKCASSAVQNIFLRFGYTNDLKFVLPMKGNYLGHPTLFTHTFVPFGKYNILTHHTRLNYPEMSLLMPNNTVYITILRNPVSMFESMYNYYELEKFYKFEFKNFDKVNLTKLPDMSKRFVKRIGLNQMFFDLGFDLTNPKKTTKNMKNNTTTYQPYIKYLDSVFDLVMIEEHMNESLILLKNLLCWSIDDVVTFRVNARIRKQNVGELATNRIKKLNQADVELYEYFLEKFKTKLKAMDKDDLKRDLKELELRKKYWFNECVDVKKMKQNLSATTKSNIIQFDSRKDNLTICKFLTSKELELTKLVRERQIKSYPDSVYKSIFQQKKSMLLNKLSSLV